jgi:hypothetical protein
MCGCTYTEGVLTFTKIFDLCGKLRLLWKVFDVMEKAWTLLKVSAFQSFYSQKRFSKNWRFHTQYFIILITGLKKHNLSPNVCENAENIDRNIDPWDRFYKLHFGLSFSYNFHRKNRHKYIRV